MGLLDALYKLRAKGEQYSAQARGNVLDALEQQAQQRAGRQTVDAYRGILANPDLGVAGAGNLGQLLQSPDPAARQQGQALIAQYIQGRGPDAQLAREATQAQIDASLAGTQATTFGNLLKALGERREKELFPLQRRALEANIEQSEASTRAAGQAGASSVAQLAGQLRDDFINHPQVSDFADTWSSAQQLRASLKSGSAVGAQGAIIKLARIYDPGGVVREGEASVYRGSFGALQAMQNSVKAAKGKGFSAETQRDIENLVDDLLESTLPGLETITDQFSGMALRNGADPRDVIALPIEATELEALQERLAQRRGDGLIPWAPIQRQLQQAP